MKTHLNDLFDQIEPEEGNKLDDRIKISTQDQLEFDHLIEITENPDKKSYASYRQYFNKVINKKYSSKQIKKFSVMLNDEILNEIGSTCISELINYLITSSDDSIHQVYTNHLTKKIGSLGIRLENKTLKVYGDVAEGVGTYLNGGKIIVKGNATDLVGLSMNSGSIYIKGNCYSRAGFQMTGGLIDIQGDSKDASYIEGGKVIIRGSVERGVGFQMSGGTLEVHGNIPSLSRNIIGGDIYHKNKLIVKNGEIIDRSYLK